MIIGVTSGCFDILHPLHILYLIKCSRECDLLYVLVDSDELILSRKGRLPVFNERDRVFMLQQLKLVKDTFVMNSKENLQAIVLQLKATKLFKHKSIIDKQPLWDTGAENVLISDVKVFETSTEIKNFLKS